MNIKSLLLGRSISRLSIFRLSIFRLSIFRLSLSGLALLAFVGCTTGGNSVPMFHEILKTTADQNGRACVRPNDIRGFGVLDHDVVSIDGRREYYLATVLPGCNSLSTSPQALFASRFNEVCGGGMHKVYAGGDNCTIRHIFEFESREAAFAAHKAAVEKRKELQQAAEEP